MDQAELQRIKHLNHILRTQTNIIRVLQHLAIEQSKLDKRISRIESMQLQLMRKAR